MTPTSILKPPPRTKNEGNEHSNLEGVTRGRDAEGKGGDSGNRGRGGGRWGGGSGSRGSDRGGRWNENRSAGSTSNGGNGHTFQRGAGRQRGYGQQSGSTTGIGSAPLQMAPQGYLPSFLPGSSSLIEQLDKRLLIVLRDGRHLIGVLRSFDQFSNFVLEDTSERRFCVPSSPQQGLRKNNINSSDKEDNEPSYYYCDIHLGLYLMRGDSIVLIGEAADHMIMPSSDQHGGVQPQYPLGKEVDLDELENLLEKYSPNNGTQINWDFDTDLL